MTFDGRAPNVRGLFTEVRPVRSFEDIALQVQDAISSGQLKEGDRLPNERQLGTLFGVSRATLREALRVLEGAGAIQVRRGASGGIFVSEPNAAQVAQALEALIRFRGVTAAELAEFRGSFEAETAFWAAKRASDEEIARLNEIVAEYAERAELPETRWTALVDLDIAFHEQVAFASHNQVRVAIMLGIHGALRQASLMIEGLASAEFRRSEADELTGIARAIGRRQPPNARRRMREHVLRNSDAEVIEQYRHASLDDSTRARQDS